MLVHDKYRICGLQSQELNACMSIQRVNVLGVGVSAITMPLAVETIEKWIIQRQREYVCVTNVHLIMECQRDEKLRQIHNRAGMVTPDGMPLVWLSHLNGFQQVERVYGPDLLLAFCARSATQGYRHYFYGGAEGVPQLLVKRLKQRFPGLEVAGMFSPPFTPLSPREDAQIVEMINQTRPDVIWVGLGAPKQERWMAAHLGRIQAPVMIGVGAAFDFHSGLKPQAPYWMQRHGLEWIFRLATEPQRLWRRYLIYNPLFIFLVLQQFMGLRRYKIHSV